MPEILPAVFIIIIGVATLCIAVRAYTFGRPKIKPIIFPPKIISGDIIVKGFLYSEHPTTITLATLRTKKSSLDIIGKLYRDEKTEKILISSLTNEPRLPANLSTKKRLYLFIPAGQTIYAVFSFRLRKGFSGQKAFLICKDPWGRKLFAEQLNIPK